MAVTVVFDPQPCIGVVEVDAAVPHNVLHPGSGRPALPRVPGAAP